MPNYIKNELKKHQFINLNFCDKFLLYFSLILPFSNNICGYCWKKHGKLIKMYEKA